MQRRIVGWRIDDVGDWVAELDCHHRQHVRDRPPLWPNPWVADAAERSARIGSPLACAPCDRCELPDGLAVARTTADWDEHSVPTALTRHHRVASDVWGLVRVHTGELRFVAETDPRTDTLVRAGSTQPIPPEVEHRVEIDGPVRFRVDFLVAPDAPDAARQTAGPTGRRARGRR